MSPPRELLARSLPRGQTRAPNKYLFAPTTLSSLGAAPAKTLASTIQQLALGLGVAVGSVALRIGQASERIGPNSHITPYRIAFLMIAVVTLTSVVEALRLPRDAGANIGGGTSRNRARPT